MWTAAVPRRRLRCVSFRASRKYTRLADVVRISSIKRGEMRTIRHGETRCQGELHLLVVQRRNVQKSGGGSYGVYGVSSGGDAVCI